MKKVFSILTALVMCSAMFGFTAFAADGKGTGGGNGENQLDVVSVSVGETALEGAEVSADGVISIIFSRGMTDNAATNSEKIVINGAEGAVETKVEMGADKSEMTVTYEGLESGEYTLVIGAEVASNNGKTLGEDVKVKFTVAGETAPVDAAPAEIEEPSAEKDTVNAPAEKSSAMPIAIAVIAVVVIAGAVVAMKKKK